MDRTTLIIGSIVMIICGFIWQNMPSQISVGLGLMWVASSIPKGEN